MSIYARVIWCIVCSFIWSKQGHLPSARAQLPWGQDRKTSGEATRSIDPRLRTPQFQKHQENLVIRALEGMRIHRGTADVPQPAIPLGEQLGGSSPPSFRFLVPRPPTPPRPSQKRLGEEEALAFWSDDSNSIDENVGDIAINDKVQDEEAATSSPGHNRVHKQEETSAPERMIFVHEDEELDEAFWESVLEDVARQTAVAHPGKHDGASATEQQEKDNTTRWESEESEGEVDEASKSGDSDGLSKAVVDNRTREDSLVPNRVRTQEERAALERMIFGDEDEVLDEAFWEVDGALQTAVAHSGKYDGASATDEQERESEESEGEVDETSKSDGLFGATSTTFPLTASEDGHPRSHQGEEDGNAVAVQDNPEVAAGSASVDTLDGVENALPTPTTSTLPTSPEPSGTAFCPSSTPESGFGVRPTKDEAPTRILLHGGSLEADVGANDDRPDPVPVPITPSVEELGPWKPAVAARSKGEPQCNSTRRVIRKMGLLESSRTRSFVFSIPPVTSSDDSLGKRKRSREDDGDDGLPVVLPRLVA